MHIWLVVYLYGYGNTTTNEQHVHDTGFATIQLYYEWVSNPINELPNNFGPIRTEKRGFEKKKRNMHNIFFLSFII